MSKADKIEKAMIKIMWAGLAAWAIIAAREAAKRKGEEDYFADKHNGTGVIL